jgi:hypothetical protein
VFTRLLRIALTALGACLLVAQFIRPERTNPPFDAEADIVAASKAPQPIADLLKRSCKDCHSYETVWPWYSNVAPASWLVARDVREARMMMTFSEWAGYDASSAADLLEAMCQQATLGRMPLWQYRLIHWGASLDEDEVKMLCDWTKAEQERLLADQ